MTPSVRPPRARDAVALGALAIALAAAPVAAQDSGNGFLLHKPDGSLAIRAGWDHAIAGSDIFTDPSTIGKLTLSKNDFSSASIAADAGVRISERFDFVIGSALARSSKRSHYRDFTEGADNREIEQDMRFTRVPISASLKAYLSPRGRSVGHFAWIPNRVSPYVGAGGGFIYYKFRQQGDFIDFNSANMRIFTSTFESSNWAPQGHAFGGMDYSVSPHLSVTGEARYTFGKGSLSADYQGFDRIDLSGVAISAGMAVRF